MLTKLGCGKMVLVHDHNGVFFVGIFAFLKLLHVVTSDGSLSVVFGGSYLCLAVRSLWKVSSWLFLMLWSDCQVRLGLDCCQLVTGFPPNPVRDRTSVSALNQVVVVSGCFW